MGRRIGATIRSSARTWDGAPPSGKSQRMPATGATDFDIATLRSRRTNKWHKFAPDVRPAGVADMDFGVAPSITAALSRLNENQEYGYAAREGALADAFVRRMKRRFGWQTDAAD